MAKRINSCKKGKRGELEACKYLASLGFDCERTAQHCGNTGQAADIRSKANAIHSLGNIHPEIKTDRSIGIGTKSLADAFDQACRDRRSSSEIPCVIWKEHRKGWRLTALWGDNMLATVATDEDIQTWLFENSVK